MGVKIGHHGLDRGVGNGLGIAPGVALQGPAHPFSFFGTEAHGAFAVVVEVHLVHIALAQSRGVVLGPAVSAIIHFDGGRVGGESRCGQQAQHTHQHEQQSRHAGECGIGFSHKSKAPFHF